MNHDEPSPTFAPRSLFSTWIGVVLLFAFFSLLVLAVIGASPRGNNYEKKRAKVRAEKLQTAREESNVALTTYGWVDKNKGIARIPINEAMQLTLAELAQKKPAPANPIATPAAPSPTPQNITTAGSPTPTLSPTASASLTPKPTSITGPNSENRGQPAAAANPPSVLPGTQPGASATPAASHPSSAAKSQPRPSPSAKPGSPVRGKKP